MRALSSRRATPAVASRAQWPANNHHAIKPVHVHRLTILLVHAEADMRLYLRTCLYSLQPPPERVIESADGTDALRIARAEHVDLVIADVGLRGLDGRRLRQAIHDDDALQHVDVMLGDIGNGAAESRDSPPVLAAPFNRARLLAMVQEGVRRA